MKQKNIVILGSTGSIGEQTLDIVRENRDLFNVIALSCNGSWQSLARQAEEFSPSYVLACEPAAREKLRDELSHSNAEVLADAEELNSLAALDEADIILNALVGFAGFEPTVRALRAGKKVALANKESLVVGGRLITDLLHCCGGTLVPVDSEHSAIFQCLKGEEEEQIEKLIITASGGPFRTWSRRQMENITVDEALNHPNWSMGAKITTDSATMMNKGLEVIEAHWLFDIPLEKIEAVVHPQSIIHSIVTFADGSSKAQMGPPLMKVPILYALTYPRRIEADAPRLDWNEAFNLTFEPVDRRRFPCFGLALQAIREGGNAPAILNAANEVAVQRFLDEEISYIQISSVIDECLNKMNGSFEASVEALKQVDEHARRLAASI